MRQACRRLRRVGRPLLAASATVALAAQDRLDVRLRADPGLAGPPGLVYARQLLPRFDPQVQDARAGLRVEITRAGVRATVEEGPLPAGTYLLGTLAAGGSVLAITCDDTGYETWRGTRDDAARIGPVRDLLAQTGSELASAAATSLDVAVLVGLLGTGFETESPVGLLLTAGAAECGNLYLRAPASGDGLILEGRSGGGLALPALLLRLARGDRDGRAPDVRASLDEESWVRLAFAARDGRREEAALQLARFRTEGSERCLRALLHAEPGPRVRAIESLARRGACEALPAMVAAAHGDADAAAAASAAVASLWPSCTEDVRAAARARAGADPALQHAIERIDGVVRVAAIDSVTPRPPRAQRLGPARLVAALLLACTSLILFWRVVSAWARPPG